MPEKREIIIKGLPAAPGYAIGPVFIYSGPEIRIEKRILQNAAEIEEEIGRFYQAVEALKNELVQLRDQTIDAYGEKLAELFELQIGILQDEILLKEIEEKILREKINATYSIFEILRSKKEHFLSLSDDYFRSRAYEIQDIKQKLIAKINGNGEKLLKITPSVVVAHDLTPADTMRFHQANVLGYVTETGGVTSHASIMAKALEIPSVVGCENILNLAREAATIIVDGFEGLVILHPEEMTLDRYLEKKKAFQESMKTMVRHLKKKTLTTDNQKIYVDANLEFVEEIEVIKKYKANGIGLFRTEGLFLSQSGLPGEEEQYKIYKTLAEVEDFEHVTIRTLDLGGDKLMPELHTVKEMNPYLGWRAIRLCLGLPEIFRTQIRAILRANRRGNIRIMLPFISSYDEVIRAKDMIHEEAEKLRKQGYIFSDTIRIGIMIEIPSAVFLADILAEEVDFFSIGTNDLTQYTLAVDRNNEKVADLYSPFHPAVLRAIQHAIETGLTHGVDVEMCGEMAGNPIAVPLLIGLGLRIFSVGHHLIPQVKRIVSSTSSEEAEQLAKEILKLKTTREVEKILQIYFREKYQDIPLIHT